MIKPVLGIQWATDILTGQQPFPTFQREKKGEGFQEVLEKEMEGKPWEKETVKNALTTT